MDIDSNNSVMLDSPRSDAIRYRRPSDEPTHDVTASRLSAKAAGPFLSPIYRLPTELLQDIFIFCLPRDKFIQPSPLQAPLLLTHICAPWRNIGISLPALWSSLQTNLPKKDTSMDTHKFNSSEIMRLWLSRAGETPLSFSFRPGHAELFVDVVVNSASMSGLSLRWRHLKMYIPKGTSISFLIPDHLPLLETLEISTTNGLHRRQIELLSNALLSVPNLSQFIWRNSSYSRSAGLQMRWSNLTRLVIEAVMTIQLALKCLSVAHRLVYVSLRLGWSSTAFIAPRSSIITLPGLKSLIIRIDGYLLEFLLAVAFPNLHDLRITHRAEWPHAAFMAFLERSNCHLQSFSFYSVPVSEVDLVTYLERFNGTLKELTLHEVGVAAQNVTDAILVRLTDFGVGDKSVLCPKIERVRLGEITPYTFGLFVDMVKSRMNPCNGASDPIKVIKMIQSFSLPQSSWNESTMSSWTRQLYKEVW
ncbi:hypothetical protein B0H34DRAFT_731777 [Crassisporium funariophilum]|nr:hypothetical protein B0H34DRAFT_731777 [Crassisporium funariophilum]